MRRDPKRDIFAGFTVAIVALPLSLGFGVASGAGAEAGLITAIVAGGIAALFGGSNFQVSGPTGAMTVVLIPIVQQFGLHGALLAGFMAGVVLIVLAVTKAGSLIKYVPISVIEGFTLGIAVVIGLQQIPSALGSTDLSGHTVLSTAASAVGEFFKNPQWPELAIAVGTAAIIIAAGAARPQIPIALLAVAVAGVITHTTDLSVATIQHLPSTLPAPSLGFLTESTLPLAQMHLLIFPVFAIAAVGALEGLLCATMADRMRAGDKVPERHDSGRELFGQGLANLAAPLFGGVAATAAIARTSVNVRSGAVSRLSGLTHAALLAIAVFAAAPLVAHIPLAALAGVLLGTSVRMIEVYGLSRLVRSTKRDGAVLILTAVTTVVFDIVTAVLIGIILAGVLTLRAIVVSSRADVWKLSESGVTVYRMHGPLCFMAAAKLTQRLSHLADEDTVVLKMENVSTMDLSGTVALTESVEHLEKRGVRIVLSGLHPVHRNTWELLHPEQLRRVSGPEADEVYDTVK